jgi:prefoldin alpha subunit
MEEKEEQEFMLQLRMFEQQIQQLQQQMQAVEQGILDLTNLNFGLDEIKNSSGKEILAPLGRGVFVKTKLVSEDLSVDVGGKNFVKKSVEETKKIIEGQIKKLEEIKKDLDKNYEEISREITNKIIQAQKEKEKN